MNIIELLGRAIENKASDFHATVAMPPTARINGQIKPLTDTPLAPQDVKDLVSQMLTPEQHVVLEEKGELDLSFANPGLGRFRVNVYKQRGSYGIVARVVATVIPSMEKLNLPPVVKTLASKPRGLILVTGPTGSGKSTTLATMIDYINQNQNFHILTLEDPIEYLHKHNKSVVNQREIGSDSQSFASALRAALRQDPDVILVGEMRDLETISTAITAAETGHLVMSTLHTIGAAKTVDRIIDVFPPHQQAQIRVQLGSVLEGVVSQILIPKADGSGRVAAFETLVCTPAIRNLVREGKTHQIPAAVQTGGKFGMKSLDTSLVELCRMGHITKASAMERAADPELFERMLGF